MEMDLLQQLRSMGEEENVTERPKGYIEPDTEESNSVIEELNNDGTLNRLKAAENNKRDMALIDATARSHSSEYQSIVDEWDKEILHQESMLHNNSTHSGDIDGIQASIDYAKKKRKEYQAYYDSARAFERKNLSEVGLGFADFLAGIGTSAAYSFKRYAKSAGAEGLASAANVVAEYIDAERNLIPEQKPGVLNYLSRVAGRTAPWIAALPAGALAIVTGGIVLGHGQMQEALEKSGVTDDASVAKATYIYGTLIGGLMAVVPVATIRAMGKPATGAFYGSMGKIAAKAAAGTLKMGIAQAATMEATTWAQLYGISDASGKPIDMGQAVEQSLHAALEGFVSGAMFGGVGEVGKLYGGAYRLKGKKPEEPPTSEKQAPPVDLKQSADALRASLQRDLADLATRRSPEAVTKRASINAKLNPRAPIDKDLASSLEEARNNLDVVDAIIKETEGRIDIDDQHKAALIENLNREQYVETIRDLENEVLVQYGDETRLQEYGRDQGRAPADDLETPTFEDIRLVMPRDQDGYPDVNGLPDMLESRFGKRTFSELDGDEKRQLYLDFSEADGGAVAARNAEADRRANIEHELARIDAKIEDIRADSGMTEDARESMLADLAVHRDYVAREMEVPKPPRPAKVEPGSEPKPINPIHKAAFRDILRGDLHRTRWSEALGVDEQELADLIDDARQDGLVRIDRHGEPRRTKLARKLATDDIKPVGAGGAAVVTEAAQANYDTIKQAVRDEVARFGSPAIAVDFKYVIETRGKIAGDENLSISPYSANRDAVVPRSDEQNTLIGERQNILGRDGSRVAEGLSREDGPLGTRDGTPEARSEALRRLNAVINSMRITRKETVPRRSDGSLIVGRLSTEKGPKKKGDIRPRMSPDGTEKFNKVKGYDGTVTDVPLKDYDRSDGIIAKTTYRLYEKGAAPLKPDETDVSTPAIVEMKQHADGAWEVSWLHVHPDHRGKGVATKLYDAIEKDIGIRLSPSGILTSTGYAFWNKRSPESVAWHQPDPRFEGTYSSPRAISDDIGRVGKRMALPGADIARLKHDRGILMKMWGKIPPEAKAAKDDMLALRGFYHAPLRAVQTAKQKKGTPQQWWSLLVKTPGVKKPELDWMGIEQWLNSDAPQRQRLTEALTSDETISEETDRLVSDAENPRDALDQVPEQERAVVEGYIKKYYDDKSISKDEIETFIKINKGDVEEIFDPFPGYADEQWNPFGSRGYNYRMLFITHPNLEGKWLDPHDEFHKHGPVITFQRMWDLPDLRTETKLSDAEFVEYENLRAEHDRLVAEFDEKWRGWDGNPNSKEDRQEWDTREAEWKKIDALDSRITELVRKDEGRMRLLGVGDIQSGIHQKGLVKGYISSEEQSRLNNAYARYDEINSEFDEISKKFEDEMDVIRRKKDIAIDEIDALLHSERAKVFDDHRDKKITDQEAVQLLQSLTDSRDHKTYPILNEFANKRDSIIIERDKANEIVSRKYQSEIKKLDKIIEDLRGRVPRAPFQGDMWWQLALKHILRYAVENGYDAIQLASPDAMHRAVGMSKKFSDLMYNKKFPRFLAEYTKKWGAKIEDAEKPLDADTVRDKARDVAMIDDADFFAIGKLDIVDYTESEITAIRNRVLDLMTEAAYRLDHGESIDAILKEEITIDTIKSGSNHILSTVIGQLRSNEGKILKFTPELRKAVLEGQPLSLMGSGAPQIRGKASAYDRLISLGMQAIEAEATAKGVPLLSATLRTARHEVLEIFHEIGLLRPEEMNILRRTAKENGWVESQGVRDAYTEYYRDGMTPEQMEDLLIKEAIFEQIADFETGAKKFEGRIQEIFQRIKDFFTGFMNWLRGDGWQTHDDIFTRYNSGELAKRYQEAFGPYGNEKPLGKTMAAAYDQRLALARRPHPIEETLDELRAELGLEMPVPWQKETVRKQFYDALARRTKLDVPTLAKKLKISADDVRALLNDAVQEGWLTRNPQTGKWRRIPEAQRPGNPEADVSIRQQIVHVATSGGDGILETHGDKIETWLSLHGDQIENFSLPASSDPIGDGFRKFFKEYVLRPATLRSKERKLYDEFRDYLDNETPDFLENLDKLRDLAGDRLIRLKSGTTPASLITGGGIRGHYVPRPAVKMSRKNLLKSTGDFWKRNFQPELVSDKALEADAVFAMFKSATAQERDMIEARDDELYKYWNTIDEQQRIEFLRDIEIGSQQKTKEMQDIADRYRMLLDVAHKLEKVYGSKAGYIEDYFPHIWNNAGKARDHFASVRASNSLGPTWFQKQRFYDLIEEGRRAGLELKSTNPQELVTWRLLAGADMRQRMELIGELTRMGLAVPAKNNQKFVNAGWQAINAPNREQYLIAPDVQYLWKNAVEARGLWQNETAAGSIFRGWMKFKNGWVPIKLMLSMFHPLHVWHIAWSNNIARAYTQLVRGGDIGGAIKSLASFWDIRQGEGYIARHAWLKPRSERTDIENGMVDLMNEGGFVPQLSEQLKMNARRTLQKSLAEGKYLKALPQVLYRGIERMQYRIFENWIPGIKAAAYLRESQALLDRRPDLLNNSVQRRVALRAIAKSVDNRFGEMFYGSLFWNRVIKDASIGSFLSLGWNLGFVREFGGATVETATRTLQRTRNLPEANRNIREATNKQAFAFTYVFTALVLSGALNRLLSGEWPKEFKDLVFPKIGGNNPDGSPRRITHMFYTREVPMLTKHIEEEGSVRRGITSMIWNKTLFQPFIEIAENKDYWGYEIWDENSPAFKQAFQFVSHIFTDQLSPITASGAKRAAEQGGSWLDKGVPLSFLGFSPAPAYVERSSLDNRIRHMYHIYVSPQKKPYDREDADAAKRVAKTKLRLALQRGDRKAAVEARREAIKAGARASSLTRHRLNTPTTTYLFSRLPDEVQEAVLKMAGPEEFKLYRRFATTKVKRKFRTRLKPIIPSPQGVQ